MKSFELRKKEFIKQQLKEKIPQKKALQQQLLDLKLLKKSTNIDSVVQVIKHELTQTGKLIKKIKQELGVLEKHRRNWNSTDYKKKNFEYKTYDANFFIELEPNTFIFNENNKIVEVTHESDYHFIDIKGKTIIKRILKNIEIYSKEEVHTEVQEMNNEAKELIKINKQLDKLLSMCLSYEKRYDNHTIRKITKILPFYIKDTLC